MREISIVIKVANEVLDPKFTIGQWVALREEEEYPQDWLIFQIKGMQLGKTGWEYINKEDGCPTLVFNESQLIDIEEHKKNMQDFCNSLNPLDERDLPVIAELTKKGCQPTDEAIRIMKNAVVEKAEAKALAEAFLTI